MSHLTAADRGKIEVLLQEKYTNKNIARKLGRSPSTVGFRGPSSTGVILWQLCFLGQTVHDYNHARNEFLCVALMNELQTDSVDYDEHKMRTIKSLLII